MIKKIALRVSSVGLLALPFLAQASEFGTSTAPTVIGAMITDVATVIGAVVGTILGVYAGLVGLGWGVRKFKHYVSGRKF